MKIERDLLNNFTRLYEKQERLSSLTDQELFGSFSNSEVHTLDIIGSFEEVNGVLIASKLDMTRGAISKIIAKLSKKDAIYKYQTKENKKEIYYGLTDYGKELYEKHKLAHKDWENRESEFFHAMEEDDKEKLNKFLIKYNDYLNNLIKERS